MTRLLAKLPALAIIALCSCTEAPSDVASVGLGGANDGATSGPVIADNRLIPGKQRPISLELSVQSGNRLLLSVVSDTDKPLFAERNLLVHGISGVPMLFPFVLRHLHRRDQVALLRGSGLGERAGRGGGGRRLSKLCRVE